ncbi:zinc finger protein 93-like [Sitophilus oryzae]|uniref:Zinc finger protein 93-like n=1 Tax=Sitophilus oryzae TaxID=7048 RepID=A0A6J2XP08_SITOR|nr:zinc finger protein 93-like [Sitophilus oryzae]
MVASDVLENLSVKLCWTIIRVQYPTNGEEKTTLGLNSRNCTECKICFNSKYQLLKHKKQVHSNEVFSCEICLKTFATMFVLKRHKQRIHYSDRPYFCDFCDKRFPSVQRKTAHERTNHLKAKLVGICNCCNKSFFSKVSLERHLQLSAESRNSKNEKYNKTKTDLKEYPCEICGNVLSTIQSYKRHKQRHGTSKVSVVCNVCGKTIVRDNITIHMRRHTGEKPFKCDRCPMAFVRSSLLAEHKRVHSNESPYQCLYCQKRFTVKSALNKHIIYHEGIKSHQCQVCLKRFYQKYEVKRHKCTGPSNQI